MNEQTRDQAPWRPSARWAALPPHSEVAEVPRQRGRLRATADARLLAARVRVPFLAAPSWRPVLVACGALPFVGAGGYLAGVYGANLIGQVLAAVGLFLAATLALSAVTAGHTRHCPGCRWH